MSLLTSAQASEVTSFKFYLNHDSQILERHPNILCESNCETFEYYSHEFMNGNMSMLDLLSKCQNYGGMMTP